MQSTKAVIARFTRIPISDYVWFLVTIAALAVYTSFGPAEHSLGTHIRVVYLHGAWVWTSIAAFLLAAAFGGLALLTRRTAWHCWSDAFGKTGIIFWITYLPMSLWAMQTNWNGLFLAEPRWRLALVFAVSGLLLQVGLGLAGKQTLTSAMNLGYFVVLIISLQTTANVMHPASPILSSDAWRIQLFFIGLVLLTLIAAWQVARWWYKGEPSCIRR